jgi:hypothetical protein
LDATSTVETCTSSIGTGMVLVISSRRTRQTRISHTCFATGSRKQVTLTGSTTQTLPQAYTARSEEAWDSSTAQSTSQIYQEIGAQITYASSRMGGPGAGSKRHPTRGS